MAESFRGHSIYSCPMAVAVEYFHVDKDKTVVTVFPSKDKIFSWKRTPLKGKEPRTQEEYQELFGAHPPSEYTFARAVYDFGFQLVKSRCNRKARGYLKSDKWEEPEIENIIFPRVCIDGNLGSGKTTLCEDLQDYIPIALKIPGRSYNERFVPEFLEKFYAEMNANKLSVATLLALECNMLASSQHNYESATKESDTEGAFLDRSPSIGHPPFAYTHYVRKRFGNDGHFALYLAQCANALDVCDGYLPDYAIFLACTAATALKRIKARKRAGESGITEDYLADLDHANATQLSLMVMGKFCPVIVFDVENQFVSPSDVLSAIKNYEPFTLKGTLQQVDALTAEQRRTFFVNLASFSRLSPEQKAIFRRAGDDRELGATVEQLATHQDLFAFPPRARKGFGGKRTNHADWYSAFVTPYVYNE